MKSKNVSKNMKGQIQQKAKNNINQVSNNKAIKQNSYNNNKNKNQINNNKNNNNNNKKNQVNSYPYSPFRYNPNNQSKNKSNNKNNNNILRNAKNNINNINGNNYENNKLSKSVKKINNKKNISPPKNIPKLKEYQFMEFHPYTLKEYREMARNPVVLGGLGPNIGTKEWEEKKQRMKRRMNYSNNINKEHKGIKTLKKDTPKDEIEKLTKEKIENSARFKTYEYGKFIRTGKYKEEFDEKEFRRFNNRSNDNLNMIQEKQENEMNNNINNSYEENNNGINNEESYEQLMEKNKEFQSKIDDIKEHILD